MLVSFSPKIWIKKRNENKKTLFRFDAKKIEKLSDMTVILGSF